MDGGPLGSGPYLRVDGMYQAETCKRLPGRVRRIERHRLSGYQSLGLRKHLDEPQNGKVKLYI